METIRKIVVPLPPLPEQDKLVEELKRFIQSIRATEESTKQGIEQSERLRCSILSMAFDGKLVPQDPKDGPADLLLEEIRREKSNCKDKNFSSVNNKKNDSKQMKLV
jgi:type I restriction enzyme, S subunit